MTATKITELQNHVANIGNDKLLKVAAIYGAISHLKSLDILRGDTYGEE